MLKVASLKTLVVKRSSSEALGRFHPWIFSGALVQGMEDPEEGEWVNVADQDKRIRCTGYYSKGSIAIRVLSFVKEESIEAIIEKKIISAVALRRNLGFMSGNPSNGFRIFNAEGDGIPGLIIDIYGDTMVFQAHARPIWKYREFITAMLAKNAAEIHFKTVYDKSETGSVMPETADRFLVGNEQTSTIEEYEVKMNVNFVEGQKTGTFLDQRENRKLLEKYAAGKKVLNAFCYSGGFSLYALRGGAIQVDSVDLSARAMQWTDENVMLNFGEETRHRSQRQDVFDFLQHGTERYDLIVLDPPAFSKGIKTRHQAIQAYRRLNALGLSRLNAGGTLFTFSCSQSVGAEFFEGAIRAAAIDSGKAIRILQRLQQPADHPVSIYHPEGEYLKGFILRVE